MLEYRGYEIELTREGHVWLVSIHPTRPDLPILRQYRFRPKPFPEGAVLAEAKRRVDRLLSGY